MSASSTSADVVSTGVVDERVGARARILAVAYELFSHRGIRAVGVDELIARADVAKSTFYRFFPSKQELVLEFLQRREQLWTWGVIEAGARERGETPEQQLLAIFDVFDDWFAREDFEACSFVNVLLEMGAEDPAGQASIEYLDHIRAFVATMAAEAGLSDADQFARSWHILMKGAIILAAAGDSDAARRAKLMAVDLIARYRRPSAH